MLDKIINITPGSDYRNSQYKNQQHDALLQRSSGSSARNDSIIFSPAWQLLAQLNWQMINIKHFKDEKITIDVAIAGLEFSTVIDLNDFNSSYLFSYIISQKRTIDHLEKTSFLTLDTMLTAPAKVTINEYRGLSRLFERVWALNFNNELNSDECRLDTMLEEIYNQVEIEINFITSSLVSFLEKLLNKTFSYMQGKDENNFQSITIKRIKSLSRGTDLLNA